MVKAAPAPQNGLQSGVLVRKALDPLILADLREIAVNSFFQRPGDFPAVRG